MHVRQGSNREMFEHFKTCRWHIVGLYLCGKLMLAVGELLTGHVDECDSDTEAEQWIIGQLAQRSHILTYR